MLTFFLPTYLLLNNISAKTAWLAGNLCGANGWIAIGNNDSCYIPYYYSMRNES